MEKINVAQLLKDCPSGMELDCTIWDNCTFEGIEDVGYTNILVKTPNGLVKLSKEGYLYHNHSGSKCVIFPKGKTTWEGFVPPRQFKNGDIVYIVTDECDYRICIFERIVGNNMHTIASVTSSGHFFCPCKEQFDAENFVTYRLATEEEKAKLFKAIRDNGYKWNAETKTLEKLTPDKFDITSLVPFESRVLVRTETDNLWKPAIFGCYIKNDYAPYFTLGGICWEQCIPYEGNQHLLGTTDDCDEFYKTWK